MATIFHEILRSYLYLVLYVSCETSFYVKKLWSYICIYIYLEDVKMITMIPTMDSKIEMAAKAMSAANGSSDHQM